MKTCARKAGRKSDALWAWQASTLVYAPITFAGQTLMRPSAGRQGSIPADDEVMRVYHQALREHQGLPSLILRLLPLLPPLLLQPLLSLLLLAVWIPCCARQNGRRHAVEASLP